MMRNIGKKSIHERFIKAKKEMINRGLTDEHKHK